jgi:adenosylmethionine-8-amino-7-oxononanoate aminotransferase
MIDLIEESSQAIDDLIDVVGRGAVEAVLQLSAQQLTGAKSQGRKVMRENGVRWHGRQWGSVALSDRKLRVERPRLRDRQGEVTIPAYAVLQDDERMSRKYFARWRTRWGCQSRS